MIGAERRCSRDSGNLLSKDATGIKQKVYPPIHRTRDYIGSLYARHISGDTRLTVALWARDQNDVLASQRIEVADTQWTKYAFNLEVPEGMLHRLDPADFVVEVAGDERVEVDQLSLMPADAKDGLDPDVVAMAKEMHTPLVRFGGNFTSSYHWADGVGPRDKRISMLNNSWGIPEYNSFGTDEFLEFCRQIGAQLSRAESRKRIARGSCRLGSICRRALVHAFRTAVGAWQ